MRNTQGSVNSARGGTRAMASLASAPVAAQVFPSGAGLDVGEAGADGMAPPAHPLRRLSTPPIGTETQPSAEGSGAEQAEAEASRALGVEEGVATMRGDALRVTQTGRLQSR